MSVRQHVHFAEYFRDHDRNAKRVCSHHFFAEVFKGTGISQEGPVTTPELTGSQKKHDGVARQLKLSI